jgi:drug/metabolite transporter (DMT)-like permease
LEDKFTNSSKIYINFYVWSNEFNAFFLIEELFFLKTNYDSNFFLWVLFAALSPSIVAFLLFNFVNRKLGASITGSVLYLYTVYGAIYGFFFFDEKLEIYHLIGSIMVFIGIFMVKSNDKKI